MTNSLRSVGMEVRNTDELRDIINIHEAVILKKTSIYNTENNHDNISIPEQSSTYLKQLKVITKFHLRNGGQYIADTDLNKGPIICLHVLVPLLFSTIFKGLLIWDQIVRSMTGLDV